MKKIFICVFAILIVILISCIKEEYHIVPPQLKIIVRNFSGELIQGATISLYGSKEDYIADSNLIISKQTKEDGAYIFIELEEIIYFFNVRKDGLSNRDDNYFFKDTLKSGERKIIYTIIK